MGLMKFGTLEKEDRRKIKMGYKYYQPNEKDIKDQEGDCCIRALSKVMNKTWLEIFDALVPIARKSQTVINSKTVWAEYLKQNKFKYYGISNKRGNKRPTVDSFTKKNKNGTYFIQVANHVVGAVDGTYYDTWDSGKKSMYGYWVKEDI